jgi:hypothetical protein
MYFVYFAGAFDSVNNSQEFRAIKTALSHVVVGFNLSSFMKNKLAKKFSTFLAFPTTSRIVRSIEDNFKSLRYHLKYVA